MVKLGGQKSKLRLGALCFLLCVSVSGLGAVGAATYTPIKPARLQVGDTVGLVASGFRASTDQVIGFAKERLEKIGLKVVMGKHVYQREGYFAGTDQARASDLNTMFADSAIKAIFEVRGGWGSARLLPYLDYDMIKKHPKILIGFSDITALLLAIHKKTHLVTFHGPLGFEPWPDFTVDYLKRVLFSGQAVTFENPHKAVQPEKDIIQIDDRIESIEPGIARGVLIGGNLTILVSLLGTPYEPDWQGKILFVEMVGAKNYQVDRMLEQLALAGVFKKIRGFVFGKCTGCVPSDNNRYGSLTLRQIMDHYFKGKHIPTYMGATIGHEPKNFTLPEGTRVELNADKGYLKMLTPAVS